MTERPRAKGWAVTGVVLVSLAASIAVLWILASRTETTAEQAAKAAPPPVSIVEVAVGRGRIVVRQVVACRAEATSGQQVSLAVTEGAADRAVVTGLPDSRGVVIDGQVLIEISGRPVFAMIAPLPTYRDLMLGDEGPDVVQLQSLLTRFGYPGLETDGVLGVETARAVASFYTNRGYEPPWGDKPLLVPDPGSTKDPTTSRQGLTPGAAEPPSNDGGLAEGLVVLPSVEMAVLAGDGLTPRYDSLPVGTVIGDGQGLQLDSSQLAVGCPVDVAQSGVLSAAQASIRTGGRSVRLYPISRSKTSVTYSTPRSRLSDAFDPAQEVLVKFVIHRSASPGLKVPVSAVWTDGAGQSHVTIDQGRRDVPVDIVDEANGLVIIAPIGAEDLAVGNRVMVSGTAP